MGDNAKLSAEVTPADATYSTVHWKVENSMVADIDEDGNLKAKLFGSTKVIAYTEDGCEAEYEVEVKIPPIFFVGGAGTLAVGSAVVWKKRKKSMSNPEADRGECVSGEIV